jgi:hypothetical protein
MKHRSIFLILSIVLTFSAGAQNQLKLENDKVLAVFDASNGSLVRLVDKTTGWNTINREQLGQSFEMLVPTPDRRYHNIKGREQAAPQIKETPGSIEFTWPSLKSKYLDEAIAVTFKGTVSLEENGVVYSGEIINKSNFTVEYIGWPFLGEMTVPDKKKNFVCQSKNETKELFPGFYSEHGYWGVEYPTNLSLLPENAFMLIRNDQQGIYVSSKQTTPSEMIICSFELIPGFELTNQNPHEDEMDGQLVRIQFKANHVVYTQPGMNYRLQPVQMNFYQGSWQAGADIFKKWKNSTPPAQIYSVDWMKQPLTWQKINISGYRDLISYAREGVKYGGSVLQVNGWMKFGKGPHIEVIDSLSAAIAECRRLGVKVVLEMNFTSVDFRSDWYREDLKNNVITDPFGIVYDQRMICPLKNDLAVKLETEYSNHPEIMDADGIIIDDNNHRGKTFFCFNPNHGHKVPEFLDAGTLKLDKYFANMARQYKPDFALLGYGFYDAQSAFYNGYFINPSNQGQSMHRYLDKNIPIVATVDVKTARKDMNVCLKNRYTICYDLRFYSNDLKTYPQIVQYGKQIEALRKQYSEFIWEGNFSDVIGATVSGNNLSYAVYTRKSDGKKAVVITNQSGTDEATATVTVSNSKNGLLVAFPENPKAVAFGGTVTLQPLSAAIVVEN